MIGAHVPKRPAHKPRQQQPTEREIREGFEFFTRKRERSHLVRHLHFDSP